MKRFTTKLLAAFMLLTLGLAYNAAASPDPIITAYQQTSAVTLTSNTYVQIFSGNVTPTTDTGTNSSFLILHGVVNVQPSSSSVTGVAYTLFSSTSSSVSCTNNTNSDVHTIDGNTLNTSFSTPHTLVGHLVYSADLGTSPLYYVFCMKSLGAASTLTYSTDLTSHVSSSFEVIYSTKTTDLMTEGWLESKMVPAGGATITADNTYHLLTHTNQTPPISDDYFADYQGVLEIHAGAGNLSNLAVKVETVHGAPGCTGDSCCSVGLGSVSSEHNFPGNLAGTYQDFDVESNQEESAGGATTLTEILCVKASSSAGATDTFNVVQTGTNTGTAVALDIKEASAGTTTYGCEAISPNSHTLSSSSWSTLATCNVAATGTLGSNWGMTVHGGNRLTYTTGATPAQPEFQFVIGGTNCGGTCTVPASISSVDHTIMPNGSTYQWINNDVSVPVNNLNGANCGNLFDSNRECSVTIQAKLNQSDSGSFYSMASLQGNWSVSLFGN